MGKRSAFVPTGDLRAASGPAFRATDAASAGWSERQLRSPRLIIPTPGTRSAVELADLESKAAAFHLVLPEDVAFSHLTAWQLHDLPLPAFLEREATSLDVMRDTSRSRIVREGCTAHKGKERRVIVDVGGLPVTSIADTWGDIISRYQHRLTLDECIVNGRRSRGTDSPDAATGGL